MHQTLSKNKMLGQMLVQKYSLVPSPTLLMKNSNTSRDFPGCQYSQCFSTTIQRNVGWLADLCVVSGNLTASPTPESRAVFTLTPLRYGLMLLVHLAP